MEYAFLEGFLVSVVVAAALGVMLHPSKNSPPSAKKQGLKFSSFIVPVVTVTTLHRYPYPAPKGGLDAVITWLIVTIIFGLFAFLVGAAIYAAIQGAKRLQKDGPELLGQAIKKTGDFVENAHNAASETKDRINKAARSNVSKTNSICSYCNSELDADSNFCQNCGKKIEVPTTCPSCGKFVNKSQIFCGYCGSHL